MTDTVRVAGVWPDALLEIESQDPPEAVLTCDVKKMGVFGSVPLSPMVWVAGAMPPVGPVNVITLGVTFISGNEEMFNVTGTWVWSPLGWTIETRPVQGNTERIPVGLTETCRLDGAVPDPGVTTSQVEPQLLSWVCTVNCALPPLVVRGRVTAGGSACPV